MTLELYNAATSISRKYSWQFWGKALELARSYGWRPLGTHLHEYRSVWDGSYLTNDGQTVIAKDALSLAQALERALDDIPDAGVQMDWNPKFWCEEEDLPDWLSPEEKEIIEAGLEEYWPDVMGVHPFEFFAGAEKQHLIAFIRFCRLGSFVIF